MADEEEDPYGTLEDEEENELKLNFELQNVEMESRLLEITEYQRNMMRSINDNFNSYKSESEARYGQHASDNERILSQLAELTGAMLAG